MVIFTAPGTRWKSFFTVWHQWHFVRHVKLFLWWVLNGPYGLHTKVKALISKGVTLDGCHASIWQNPFTKFFSMRPVEWFRWKLVYSNRDSSPSYFVQIMTLGWPWPFFFGKVKFCNLGFYIENLTSMDSLGIITTCDLDIGWHT